MSRFLVDTHVWLWLQTGSPRVSSELRARLADPASELLLSAASSWEIAIRFRLGKLPLPSPPSAYVPDRMRRSGTTPLGVEHAHALRAGELPEHHNDPFDRLLIAQAQILDVPLVTADEQLSAYDVAVIAV